MFELTNINPIQLSGFCVGMSIVITALIAAVKGGTESRLLGSNALSVFLYGAGLVVLIAGNIIGNLTHDLIQGGFVFLYIAIFLFGWSIDKKWRKSQVSE